MAFVNDLAEDFRRWGKKRVRLVQRLTKERGVNAGNAWVVRRGGVEVG